MNMLRTRYEDDSFIAGKHEECIDSFFIGCGYVLNSAEIVPECMFGADCLIIQSASDGVNRICFALIIGENVGMESVKIARFSIIDRSPFVYKERN